MRVPLTIGLPTKMSGSTVMRSRQFMRSPFLYCQQTDTTGPLPVLPHPLVSGPVAADHVLGREPRRGNLTTAAACRSPVRDMKGAGTQMQKGRRPHAGPLLGCIVDGLIPALRA